MMVVAKNDDERIKMRMRARIRIIMNRIKMRRRIGFSGNYLLMVFNRECLFHSK